MDPSAWAEWPITIVKPGNYFVTAQLAAKGTGTGAYRMYDNQYTFQLAGEVKWSEGAIRGPRRLPLSFG